MKTTDTLYGSTLERFKNNPCAHTFQEFEKEFLALSEGQQVAAIFGMVDALSRPAIDALPINQFPYILPALRRSNQIIMDKIDPTYTLNCARVEKTKPDYLEAIIQNTGYPEWFREMNKEMLLYVQAYAQSQPA